MKDDAPLPGTVPKKRRAMQLLLDRHIALWLANDTITPSERRRLAAEKDRRKAMAPSDHEVGVVIDEAGITPEQLAALATLLPSQQPAHVHHRGVPSRVHEACKRVAPVCVHRDNTEVVKASDVVLAFPKENAIMPYATPGVWMNIGAARRRSVIVRVISPDGHLLGEGEDDG